MNKIVPVFFAADDKYTPVLSVALTSLIAYVSNENHYDIHILTEDITKQNEKIIRDIVAGKPNVTLFFDNISDLIRADLADLDTKLWYIETFYRVYIPRLFPQYDKAIYIDCDLVLNGDIAELYNVDLGDNYVAAAVERIMAQVPELTAYANNYVGVGVHKYFNAGVLLMNSKLFRHIRLEDRFFEIYNTMKMDVAPDQDCLNVICAGRVKWLTNIWNKTPFSPNDQPLSDKEIRLYHYILSSKPWKNRDAVAFEDKFWQHAKNTVFYKHFLDLKAKVTDADIAKDQQRTVAIIELAGKMCTDEPVVEVMKKKRPVEAAS